MTSLGEVNGYGFGATMKEKMDFEVPRGYVRLRVFAEATAVMYDSVA